MRWPPAPTLHRKADDVLPVDEPDASYAFATAAAAARFEVLNPAAVHTAKCSVLDTIGVALAASGLEPSIGPFLDVVREQGGPPQATIIGSGEQTSAILAAFANGALAHCLDFDDRTPWGQHSGSSVVPSVLAVTERTGGVSGRDLITAVAVGQDLFTRLRLHTGWRKDWMLSSVGGVFAGAAACSASSVSTLTRPRRRSALPASSPRACTKSWRGREAISAASMPASRPRGRSFRRSWPNAG